LENAVHTPVLLKETLRLLEPPDGSGWMIDATAGEGGHSEAFLERFPGLRVTCVDADASILSVARDRLRKFGARASFYEGWSEDFFKAVLAAKETPDLDGGFKKKFFEKNAGQPPVVILIDLGVSLYHYEKGGRGFSFRKDEPLDMRIDDSRGLSASRLLASLREDEIAALLWRGAEERYSRRIAAAIVKARRAGALETSGALASVVKGAVPASYRNCAFHPATKTFQALRIAVNGELELLGKRLEAAFSVLAKGGRLGVISFHSSEDRIVKWFFREKSRSCVCPPEAPICRCRGRPLLRLTVKKPAVPDAEEVEKNPASRSAKLRVAEKLE
jgi:16S rRNA (cytosine1402-N4)-methyltransferase